MTMAASCGPVVYLSRYQCSVQILTPVRVQVKILIELYFVKTLFTTKPS